MLQPERQIGLAGSGFQHDRSARERIDAIGERQRFLDQLLDQQHRGPGLAQPPHHHEHAIHQYRRQAGGRLVQHEQSRPSNQTLRHRQDLLLAAGERSRAFVALGGDFGEQPEHLLDARGALAARQVVGRQQQVVEHRKLREHAVSFDDMREPCFHGIARTGAGKIATGETHASRPGQQSRHRAQQRGFAGAVGAKQRHHLARADRQVDAAQHADLAVAGGEAGDVQQRFSRRDRH